MAVQAAKPRRYSNKSLNQIGWLYPK
jgi:hypothetical protein